MSKPPTAYVDRDEYGCFVVSPASLVVDLAKGDTIRFVNLTNEKVEVDLKGVASPPCFKLKPGDSGKTTVKVKPKQPTSYPYTVTTASRFEARGGSGPKVIVDP